MRETLQRFRLTVKVDWMRRVRFTTTAGLVNELVEASSRRVTFPGGSAGESWAPQPQASCGNWRGKREEKVSATIGPITCPLLRLFTNELKHYLSRPLHDHRRESAAPVSGGISRRRAQAVKRICTGSRGQLEPLTIVGVSRQRSPS